MPHQHGHDVITAALEDWWLLGDPARPDLGAAADRITQYLTSSGYQLTPAEETPVPQPHQPDYLFRFAAITFIVLVLAFLTLVFLGRPEPPRDGTPGPWVTTDHGTSTTHHDRPRPRPTRSTR